MPETLSWLAVGGVILMLSLAGCGTPLKSQPSGSEYLSDAGQCSRASQDVSNVRVRTGVARMDLPLELGMDPTKYRQCMEARGWAPPNPEQDPYFQVTLRCRRAATQTAQVANSQARLESRLDEAAYSDCMKRGGVQGEVIVHPLQPK
jgi:hypothetical protein